MVEDIVGTRSSQKDTFLPDLERAPTTVGRTGMGLVETRVFAVKGGF
jgi:hypothetical protein